MTQQAAELGRFLRARRALVRPDDVGLPEGSGIRRTPGLRREELAALAGVSLDYYARLERGKESRPSPAVVDALASALRLSRDEHAHFRGLVDQVNYGRRTRVAHPQRAIRPGIELLLESLRPNPAYVVSRTNDLLAANPPGLGLLAGITDWPPEQRNIIRYVFLHPAARELYVDWEQLLPQAVAHLRAMAGSQPDAPDLQQLVGELAVRSREFARLWERYEVNLRSDGTKRFRHPVAGELTLGYETMSLARTDGQRLIAYHATPGTPAYDALVLLDLDSRDEAETTGRVEVP